MVVRVGNISKIIIYVQYHFFFYIDIYLPSLDKIFTLLISLTNADAMNLLVSLIKVNEGIEVDVTETYKY